MHYLLESIFVGIYSSAIAIVLYIFLANIFITFFVTGFFKHFLGYYFGIHTYYCNYGYACKKMSKSKSTADYKIDDLLGDSILEGIIFALFAYLLHKTIKNPIILVFISGMTIHIISEFTGIHSFFCNNKCLQKTI